MTTVEFLSNPTPDESVYMWRATGVDQLTRENKLSSLPFWAPNNITKKHQFRLTMLKGLTPNKDAENDSYAILLDLIPPPPSPDHQGGDTLYPGGCSVKLTVINSVDPAKSVVEESAEFLSASRLQISFPDIISKHTAKNPAFATDNLSTLTVQVHIHTGVNVAAAQVSKTVSSLWGTLTSTVSQLIEKTSEAYQETRRELEQELAKKQAPAVPSSGPLPWDVVPPKWAEKAEQWRTLVSSNIVEDDGTFLYGPERGWTPDENSMMLSVGLNPHSLSDLFDKFDYDRDIHEGLVENKVLAHQRYLIVPSKISDQKFWENYFWKVACLGECTSEPQVKTLLTVLNGPHTKSRGSCRRERCRRRVFSRWHRMRRRRPISCWST
ncbi:hypothetical protein AGDE_12322 [Angomonas deanei]|nr:hypothetical protein AGDE_12322 [Angomonas deanei]|eukprot:EPY24487.1 hypothetical protein AGDE_12322 [Angomonas deanei]